MCVYVKDTSRSIETGSVCVCVYVEDTSRSTETVCVFMSKTRVDLQRQWCVCVCERHE